MKRLSTHREALMGLAILWIMLFHAGVVFPSWLRPLTWLHETGYGGADIFLFLSGLGLYHGYAGDPLRFYRRRFIRILPTYWVVILLAAFMGSFFLHRPAPFNQLFYELSTLGFWINAAKFDWYIPSLLVLYLVFPLFYLLLRARGAVVTGIVVVFGVGLSLVLAPTPLNYLLIFTTRIPIFFLGAQAGGMIFGAPGAGAPAGAHAEAPGMSRLAAPAGAPAALPATLLAGGRWYFFVLGLAGLVAVFLLLTPQWRWWTGAWWYPFILITPALCRGAAWVFDRVGTRALRWCGHYSLEIYFVHTLMFGLHKEFAHFFAFDPSGCTAYTLYATISLPLAYALHQVMGGWGRKHFDRILLKN